MPSLFDIGKSGLQAYRQSLAVTGQNIANVNTDGYKKRDVALDFSSIAKGFAIDKVYKHLSSELNIDNLFVELGGEIRTSNHKIDKTPW